ncbi:MAG: methionyl-tRNA formyltransferase [Anaerolineales bacterium]
MPKVVFMGSPDFAVPSLRALADSAEVVGVVTQPDRPAGRGRKLQASAVRIAATKLDLPVITPARLSEPAATEQLRAWAPEVIVVAAFGQLLKPEVLSLPPHGCLNVHASLLPRHRGAAPVAAAIMAGDATTGITIMQMDAGLDTGPILAQREAPIRPDHTGGALTAELAEVGAALLIDTLPEYLSGALEPRPQDDAQATYAPRLKKQDGRIDWRQPAGVIARQIRALQPWPGAFAMLRDQPLKVLSATAIAGSAAPGEVVRTEAGIAAGTGAGLLQFELLQPAGKRPMSAADYVNGAPDLLGSTLS